jgi:hypothetical protein
MSPNRSQGGILSLKLWPMPDADHDRFNLELKDTGAGLRFRLAVREGSIAVRMVREIIARYGVIQDQGSYSYAKLQLWRRQYIQATDVASDAIVHLWDDHRWPPDAARSLKYQFRPKDPA